MGDQSPSGSSPSSSASSAIDQSDTINVTAQGFLPPINSGTSGGGSSWLMPAIIGGVALVAVLLFSRK